MTVSKWAPVAKVRAAGLWGLAAVFLTGGLTAVADNIGLATYGLDGVTIGAAVGAGATWFAAYWKRAEPEDAGKGVVR
jgi:hypothetical protein